MVRRPYQKAEHGSAVLGDVKVSTGQISDASCMLNIPQVEHLIGGMRGLKSMLWEASVLDPNEVRTQRAHVFQTQDPSNAYHRVSVSMV